MTISHMYCEGIMKKGLGQNFLNYERVPPTGYLLHQ